MKTQNLISRKNKENTSARFLLQFLQFTKHQDVAEIPSPETQMPVQIMGWQNQHIGASLHCEFLFNCTSTHVGNFALSSREERNRTEEPVDKKKEKLEQCFRKKTYVPPPPPPPPHQSEQTYC